MSDNKKQVGTPWRDRDTQKREAEGFDLLRLLGKLGMHSLRTKIFVGGLLYSLIALIVVCSIAYLSFLSSIDSSPELKESAERMGKAVDMQIFNNIEIAKSIATDQYVVAEVEKAAELAESQGIKSLPDAKQIEELEGRYAKTRVLAPDPGLNSFLNDKKAIKNVFQRMFVTDRYGLNAGMTGPTEDFVQSDEHWWQAAMKSGLYIEDVVFDKPSSTWDMEICVAVPHPKTGEPNGVLKVKYNLADAQQYFQDQTGYGFAITSTGLNVLNKYPKLQNQPISPQLQKSDLLKDARSNDLGVLEYAGTRPAAASTGADTEEQRIATYYKSDGFKRNGLIYPGFGWIYVLDKSKAEVYAQAYNMLWRTVLFATVVFLFLGFLAYLFSSSLSAAVRKLLKVTEWVRAGDMMARADLQTGDELEKVGEGFNQMMRRLSEMVQSEVEQKKALLLISKAVDSSGDAIAIRDFVRGTSYFNKTFTEVIGYTSEELEKREESLQLYNDPAMAGDMVDALERGLSWSGEVDLKARTGRIVPVSLRANAIKDEAGAIIGRIGIYTDITERKRMEEVLLNSEEQYRLLFDSNPNPMWVHDIETTKFLAVNEAALRTYEYAREEFLTLSMKDILADQEPASTATAGSDTDATPVSKHRTKTGTVIFVETSSHPLTFGGRLAQLIQAKDVTERRTMEQALKKSENEYRTLFESANDPIMILDPETEELLEVNNQACKAYGFGRNELIGMSLRSLTKDPNSRENSLKHAMSGAGSKGFETVHLRRDGTPVFFLASTSVIEYRGKKAVLGIARDITDRKKAEEVMQASLDDFLSMVSVVSAGDLTQRGNDGEGPLAAVAKGLNKMLDNFSAMLTRVKQIGLSVTSSATEILAASEQIAAGAQRQADEITNTSSAVEEMAASMSQVSRNAEASAEAARRALGMAELGDRSVRDTSEAMNRIDSAVQGTAEKMRLLAKRSSEISEIIDLINDVAAQTNLLSLNAAIEAAHAGEAGLGFSVVAEEIRKLAERSARATRDVGNLIKAIQNETSEALDAMENGMKQVKEGSTLAEQARQSLQDISHVVRQSAELIEEISAASEEQARVTRNLAGAMQTVSSITLETSAGAHQTAQTIQGMVSLSEQLNDAISQFRVSDNFVHPFSYENPDSSSGRQGNGSKMFGHSGD
jgi:PAS domain S-box-containing protein